jgi:glycosyltransferase involved in cell wall biosynthesis
MISTVRIQEHLDLYQRYGIPEHYGNRIRFIMNAIDLPPRAGATEYRSTTTVLYVGRSTAEKRVHLVAETARRVKETTPSIEFHFLGEVADAIPAALHPYCHFWGNQSNAEVIADVYNQSHILILVSDTEGFPMVVMEAMSRGLAVVSTAVGEVPLHVKDGVNGFLITPFDNGKTVVQAASGHILDLHRNRALLQAIAKENTEYAYSHFGMARFQTEYEALFAELRSNPNG